MKKKLNLLCAMIFAVLLLSLSENIYSMVWGAIEGGKAGMENKAGEINNLHPLMLLPDNLSSTSDSIYNEMTGKNVPIWQIQSMVTVDTDAPGWLALINTLLSFILIIFGIKAVLQFIKFIRNINRSDIFCWANVKLLRKLGTSLLITFATTLTSTYMHTWQLSQVLKIPGYSYNWLNPFSHSSLLLGVLAFVIAEVFAIGLKMKEEQDLTIKYRTTMKEKSKEHSLKEMKLIMTCLTIICFCCTFITIFQNAILCFELGTNRAAIDAGKAAASEQFIWQAFPQGITLLSMAVCSVFIYLMLRNVKRNLIFVRANANLIYYIGLIIEFNGILQAILNEFAPVTNPRQTYMIYILIGVFIIFIGYLFQIGIRMKEEQELTI